MVNIKFKELNKFYEWLGLNLNIDLDYNLVYDLLVLSRKTLPI